METLYTLSDLIELSEESGNDNPSIFVLSDLKTKEQSDEAHLISNVFVDDVGDIIIQYYDV